MLAPFVVGVLIGVALVWVVKRAHERERRERPVLPACYSSLLQADRSHYPGLCPACGTENTPGYAFCKECGGELPDGVRTAERTDTAWIFRE